MQNEVSATSEGEKVQFGRSPAGGVNDFSHSEDPTFKHEVNSELVGFLMDQSWAHYSSTLWNFLFCADVEMCIILNCII